MVINMVCADQTSQQSETHSIDKVGLVEMNAMEIIANRWSLSAVAESPESLTPN